MAFLMYKFTKYEKLWQHYDVLCIHKTEKCLVFSDAQSSFWYRALEELLFGCPAHLAKY